MTKTRKIPLKKREKPKQRSTTFTKRRYGLFSKAADLCKLFGVQVAILVKSINEKHGDVYAFGHPSVDSVLEAFLNNGVPAPINNQTKESAIALHDRCLALKREDKKQDSSKFWLELESMDLDNIQSVEVLNSVVERVKSLKDNVKNRLNNIRAAENQVQSGNYLDDVLTMDHLQVHVDNHPCLSSLCGSASSGFNGGVQIGGDCSIENQDNNYLTLSMEFLDGLDTEPDDSYLSFINEM